MSDFYPPEKEAFFIFGKATREDAPEILALYRSLVGTEFCAWNEDYPGEADIEEDLARDSLFCLKDMDHRIIGTISLDVDDEVEALPCWTKTLRPARELSRLGVRIENQNQGIAGILLQSAMEELKRQGYKSVHFLVCKTNQKAIRAYNKVGFDIVGECEFHNLPWWCYERQL